jgi:heme/copper-type cytochrome/quinol oxidase subunit 3
MTASPVAITPRAARPNGWWGMVLAIATEATLFGCLVASYFYLRFRATSWPPDGIPDPKLFRPLLNNGLLLATLVPVFAAGRAVRHDRQWQLRGALLAAFSLGLAYFVLQLDSFATSWRSSRPEDGAYTSIVYTITGAHWIHVGAGILLLAWLQLRAWFGAFGPERSVPVQVICLYWYFVALLAIPVVLTTLSPSL